MCIRDRDPDHPDLQLLRRRPRGLRAEVLAQGLDLPHLGGGAGDDAGPGIHPPALLLHRARQRDRQADRLGGGQAGRVALQGEARRSQLVLRRHQLLHQRSAPALALTEASRSKVVRRARHAPCLPACVQVFCPRLEGGWWCWLVGPLQVPPYWRGDPMSKSRKTAGDPRIVLLLAAAGLVPACAPPDPTGESGQPQSQSADQSVTRAALAAGGASYLVSFTADAIPANADALV